MSIRETSPLSPPGDPGSRVLALNFQYDRSATLVTTEGRDVGGIVRDKLLNLGPFVGVVSRQGLEVAPGEVYCCEFEVRAVTDSQNGKPTNFFVGPVPTDEAGRVLHWWVEQKPIERMEGVRKGSTQLTMPEGATRVQIGMLGSWADPPPAGDGVVGFLKARLYKVG